MRYTVFGSDKFERVVQGHMDLITKRVLEIFEPDDLAALVLGGSYGRGEGGVYIKDSTELPFTDYDFFIIINHMNRKKAAQYHHKLEHLRVQLEEELEIDADFNFIHTIDQLRKEPPTIMLYELRYGHKVLFGPENILAGVGPVKSGQISLEQGLRMLLDRATGLFLAEAKIGKQQLSEQERNFVLSNINKSILAAGDVYLLMNNDYHYSYRIRQEKLENHKEDLLLAKLGLVEDYSRSIDFKIRPVEMTDDVAQLSSFFEEAKLKFKQMYFIAFEAYFGKYQYQRLGYYECVKRWNPDHLCLLSKIRNLSQNIGFFGILNFSFNWFFKKPSQRLFYVIPYLLFGDKAVSVEKVNDALCLKRNMDRRCMEIRFVSIWEKYL